MSKITTMLNFDRVRTPVRSIVGLVAGLVGLANMLSIMLPRLHWDILLGEWPMRVQIGAHVLTAVSGFLLIMLSYGLMRGKRHAWRITLILMLLSTFLHILHGGIFSAGGAAILTLCLIHLAPFFQALSDPPSAWRGYTVLALGLGIVVLYTIGGFIVLYSNFEPLTDRLGIDVVLVQLLTHAHLHLPHNTQAFFFGRALPALCLSAVLYGMIQILRPVAATLLPDETERLHVAHLTRYHGNSSISYFTLGEDKSYFFSRSGKTVISYVLEGSVAVVAGDPIGPDAELLPAIQEFKEFCRQQDWTIVFWQVRAELAAIYQDADLHLLKIGEDAIIDTHSFTLKGGAMANVRTSAKRAEKEGLKIAFYQGRVQNAEQLAQMEQISARWLIQKGGSEMGFSMGAFNRQGDPRQLTAVAVDAANHVHAFVTWVPIYGRQGSGLDLMRRAETCAPGTMELLLARSIEYLKSQGANVISLGLAPLSNINAEDETFLDTSLDFLTQRFGNLSQRQSLFNFKKKFQPTWESRYLVFSHTLTLPKVGWALYKAHQEQRPSLLSTLRHTLITWPRQRVRALESLPA